MKSNTFYSDLITSDFSDLTLAVKNLALHATQHLGSLGFGTSFLQWFAAAAAIYLLVLDRTNWKTNILTGLLMPYIFFSIPSVFFNLFRGEIGRWIAFAAVILRIFFPEHFREYLELPGALILLIVVAPSLLAETVRGNWIGAAICLGIGCYLLQQHIRASGGFKNAFSKKEGLSNSIGILLLFIYPAWAIITDIL